MYHPAGTGEETWSCAAVITALGRGGAKAALGLLMAGVVMAASPAHARRYTSIVIDAETGQVLHQNNADEHNYPASLTKMMTLYLTFEALHDHRLSLGQELPVSSHAENQAPSKLGLQAGDTIRVEHAVLGLATKSANDAAVVLAEALGGSESGFAAKMTAKARELGMSRTVFRNASGLPNDGQLSTPRDMATLGKALIDHWPQFYHYFHRFSFTYNGQVHHNHNHLMERYPGMDGIKTGFINKSGFNLAASAVRNGRRLVAVVFGGPSARARDDHMAALLDEAFRHHGRGVATAAAPAPGAAQVADASGSTVPARALDIASLAEREEEAQARSAPSPRRATVTASGRGWGIQLGTYRSRSAAQHAAAAAKRHLPGGLGQPSAEISRIGSGKRPQFRAKLVGFKDQNAAKTACSKARANSCRAVGPG